MNKKLIKRIFLFVWLTAFAVIAAIYLFVPKEAYPEVPAILLKALALIVIVPMLAIRFWRLTNHPEAKKAVNWVQGKLTFKKKYE